jgi:1-acyl-sn-glycerol-3-phosphate acyltransferase
VEPEAKPGSTLDKPAPASRAWLLPLFHRVAAVSLRLYFRVTRAGHDVPRDGPLLLVANHPNSLLDPAAVAYAAQRPVRFIAKSTLFSHPVVGWLVRGAGSIPVYRRQDDPALMERNVQMFSAVHEALRGGSAVGVFPEGISHSGPSLAELRTGAARIALGAAQLAGGAFPIVPVGLVFRRKSAFRSRAHVIVGERIRWNDLAACGETDTNAVRELTSRIDAALRRVTVNLSDWADAPIVELAESVYAAEFGLRPDPIERIARVRTVTEVLGRMRDADEVGWRELHADLKRHARLLRWFRLTPASLRLRPSAGAALGWSLRRIPLALLALSGVWLAGGVLFWIPWRTTAMIAERARQRGEDLVSTARVIGGAVVFSLWIAVLSAAAAIAWGLWLGAIALVLLPLLAVVALIVRERVIGALRDARRFFRIARRSGIMNELRARQRSLAARLDTVWQAEKERARET